ncbi:MAG: hypothetical protein Q9180_005444 [Flavoplaca navasiana]
MANSHTPAQGRADFSSVERQAPGPRSHFGQLNQTQHSTTGSTGYTANSSSVKVRASSSYKPVAPGAISSQVQMQALVEIPGNSIAFEPFFIKYPDLLPKIFALDLLGTQQRSIRRLLSSTSSTSLPSEHCHAKWDIHNGYWTRASRWKHLNDVFKKLLIYKYHIQIIQWVVLDSGVYQDQKSTNFVWILHRQGRQRFECASIREFSTKSWQPEEPRKSQCQEHPRSQRQKSSANKDERRRQNRYTDTNPARPEFSGDQAK